MPPFFDELQKLPQAVRDHLYSAELESWYSAAQDRWALVDDQRPAVEEAALDVYLRRRTLDQFMQRVQELVGDEGKAKAIAIEILGNDFLKIEDYLGVDIPAYIKHLGGDPSKFVKEIPVADVVAGVMRGIGVVPSDPAIAKRIEHAVTSFLTGIRDQLETKDVLTRGTKVGGVGLDLSTADRIVQALTTQLKELRDAGVIIRTEGVKPPETSTFHLVKASRSSVMQPEDEAEIEQFRRVVPADALREQIRSAADRVVQKTGAKFKSEDISKRFRTAIESRLRDIRDYAETLDLLTRPSAQGGFGIPKEQAEKVMRVVEDEVRLVHGKKAAGQQGTRAAEPTPHAPRSIPPAPAPTTPVLPPPPSVATLVHPVPPAAAGRAGSRAAEPMPPTPKPAPPPPAKPVHSPPREIATSLPPVAPRNDTKLAPAAPPPALKPPPVPPPTPSKPQADSPKPQAPLPPVVKQIPIAPPPPKPQVVSPKPPAPPPTPPSKPVPPPPSPPVAEALRSPPHTSDRGDLKVAATTAMPSGKPKMHDIRPVPPRLVGPIEELQQLTLADFRKIAKTPTEAAARIVEKLALLERDSYTKRAEGVKALRGGPLMATYAEVLGAALMAKRKVEDELKDRLAKDRGALTWEEFQALQNLNTQIRL